MCHHFKRLVEYYAHVYKIGVHPSWQSGDDESLLKEEIEWLEVMSDKKILSSRQHFIRLTLPDTYRQLIWAGIQKDFSMGYGSINGFRAFCLLFLFTGTTSKKKQLLHCCCTPFVLWMPILFMSSGILPSRHMQN